MTTENTTTTTTPGADVYARAYELLNSGVSYARTIAQLTEEGYKTPKGRKLKVTFLNNAIPVLRKRFGYKGKTSTRNRTTTAKVTVAGKTTAGKKTTGKGTQTYSRTYTRFAPATGRDSLRFVQFVDTLPLPPQRREAVLSAYFAD